MRKYSEEYFEVINSGLGTRMFQVEEFNFGKRACAAFVSYVLQTLNLISNSCSKVSILEEELEKSGWINININDIKRGDVVVWEPNKFGIYHIGFYMGRFGDLEMAISNDSHRGVPVKHSLHPVIKSKPDGRNVIRAYALK